MAGPGEAQTRLSPAVRALIEEHHITDAELARIDGSGVGGRISKKDIEDFVGRRAQPVAANGEQRQVATEARAAPAAPAGGNKLALSPKRQAIGSNRLEDKQADSHASTLG